MQFTDADEGKSVFDADRTKIGVVVEIRNGTAYVEPQPSLTEEFKAKLDWGDPDPDEDAFPIRDEWVEEVDEKEILLRTRPEPGRST